MPQQPAKNDSIQRRTAARRTAWVVGLIALAIYLGFMLSSAFGR